jgi:hypothetical protein
MANEKEAEKPVNVAKPQTAAEREAQAAHDARLANADREAETRELIEWRSRQAQFRPIKADDKP